MKFKMDLILRLFQIFVIVIPCMLIPENHASTTYIQQACYGNGFEDYLIPTCRTGEKIFVYDVFVYAKRKELNCPQIATYFDRNITYCCNYVNEKEDCGQRYFGTSSDFEHAHYSRCSGMETCSGIPVAWNYTEHFCDISIFDERTNYMKMWYSCIPDISSMSINSISMLTDNPVFLFSENYPATMSECSVTSGATCALQTTNGSPIQITVLDLQLSDASGICSQRLYITDGFSNTEISCQDNNHFQKRIVYKSINSRIEMRLDNTVTSPAGKFWIQIEATETPGSVSVECRAAAAVYKCGSSITMIQNEVSTRPEYEASKELVTTSTKFLLSTTYESVSDQTIILAGSDVKETLKTTTPTNIEKSSENFDSQKFLKTSSEIFTFSKDMITLSSEVRKMSETYFDTQKSSLSLEGSDKLDPRLSEDLRTSSEILTLDKELSTKLSDIKKTSEITSDIKKTSLYLESSDVLDPRLSEYYKTSSVSKEMITSSSEKWKVTETFSEVQKSSHFLESSVKFDTQFSGDFKTSFLSKDMIASSGEVLKMTETYSDITKSSLYLESSNSLDTQLSEYIKTSFPSKDMVTPFSKIGKTSEMFTDIQKSSFYLQSTEKLDQRVSEYPKTSFISKDMITSSSEVKEITEIFNDVQKSSFSQSVQSSSYLLDPRISEHSTTVPLSRDMITQSSKFQEVTEIFSEIYKSSFYLESSDKLDPQLSEYFRSSTEVSSSIDSNKVTFSSDLKKTSEMITEIQKSSLYLDSSNKFDTEFSESFKLSLLSKDMTTSSKITELFSDIRKSSLYLESSVKLDPQLSENFQTSSYAFTPSKDTFKSSSEIMKPLKTSEMYTSTITQRSSLSSESSDVLNPRDLSHSLSGITSSMLLLTTTDILFSSSDLDSSSSLNYFSSNSKQYKTVSDLLLTSPPETSSLSISNTGIKTSLTDFSFGMSSYERSTLIKSTQVFMSSSFLSDNLATSIATFLHSILTDFSSDHKFLSTSVPEKTKTIDITTSKTMDQYSSSFASKTLSNSQVPFSLEKSSTETTFSSESLPHSSTLLDTRIATSIPLHPSSLMITKTSLNEQALSTSTVTMTSGSVIDTSVVSGPSYVTKSPSTSSYNTPLSFTASTFSSSMLPPSTSSSEAVASTLPTPSSLTLDATEVTSSVSVISPTPASYVSTSTPASLTNTIKILNALSTSNIMATSTSFSTTATSHLTSSGLPLVSISSSSSSETKMTQILSSGVISTTSASSFPTQTSTTTASSGPTKTSTTTASSGPTQTSTTSVSSGPTQTSTTTASSDPSQTSTTSTSSVPTQTSTTSASSDPSQTSTTSASSGPTKASTTSASSGPTKTSTTSASSGPTQTSTTFVSSGPTQTSTASASSGPTKTSTTSASSGPTKTSTTSVSSGPTQTSTTSALSGPTQTSTASASSGPTKTSTTSASSGPTKTSTTSVSSGPTQTSTTSALSGPTQTSTTTASSVPTETSTTTASSGPTQTSTASASSGPTRTSTTSASSGPTQTSTTSSASNSSTSEQAPASSDDSLDLSWVFTIFPATIGTATVVGTIMYALNRCKKRCTHVNNDETPRRRIAFA